MSINIINKFHNERPTQDTRNQPHHVRQTGEHQVDQVHPSGPRLPSRNNGKFTIAGSKLSEKAEQVDQLARHLIATEKEVNDK